MTQINPAFITLPIAATLLPLDCHRNICGYSFMPKICGIYKITSPKKLVYIGQSIDILKRFVGYKRLACPKQIKLYRSLKLYGPKNHKFEILHVCDPSELNALEIYYITLFNCFNSKYGLNLKAGGHSGGANSPETRAKLKGRVVSEETRKKMSEAAKRRVVSDETREKHRQRMIGNKNLLGRKHMIGFKHSTETKSIIKEKRKFQVMKKGYKRDLTDQWVGNIRDEAKKRIGFGNLVLNLETGIYYNSISEAALSVRNNTTSLCDYIADGRVAKFVVFKNIKCRPPINGGDIRYIIND